MYSLWFFFFFSSRRRHTRLQGDWSSDVCSSDLLAVGLLVAAAAVPDHDFALVVPPARTLLRLQQRLFGLLLGDVALVRDGDEPPRGRIWIKALQSHRCLLPS